MSQTSRIREYYETSIALAVFSGSQILLLAYWALKHYETVELEKNLNFLLMANVIAWKLK